MTVVSGVTIGGATPVPAEQHVELAGEVITRELTLGSAAGDWLGIRSPALNYGDVWRPG